MPTDEQHPPSRSLKPQMEKRRRARINDSLLQLKNLVLNALNKNNPRHSKLEKADILEMTVRYLRSIHRQQLSGIGSHNEQASIAQYQTGYAECMREVSRFLNATSNTNNSSNQAAIIQNLMNREAGERHLQASLLDHLVTRVTDHGYNTGPERMTIQEQKNAADTPNLGHSNNIPTLQFYMANKTPSMTSLQLSDAAAPRLHEEAGGGGFVNLVQSSSVFSGGGSVATLEPLACPSVNPTGPTAGEEIRLVLPGNLVYSGQIPTHVIPIYAASSPTISPAHQLQPSTVLSNIPSLSSSTPVVLTPVAPGNGHASNLLGSAVAPTSGGFAFLHTPPPTFNHSPTPDSVMDSTDKPRHSVMSSQAAAPTVPNKPYLDDYESCDINPCLIPSSFSISNPISSSSSSSSLSPSSSTASPAHDNTSLILPSTTSPSPPSPRATQIEQPSSQSRSHPVNIKYMTESTTHVTKPSLNQNTFRSVAPSFPTTSPLITAPGLVPVQNTYSISIAAPGSQQPVTLSETSSNTPFRTPSVNAYARKKRRRTPISHDKEPLGVQNTTPSAPRPRMGSNKVITKIRVSRSDMRPTTTRCRSPHRSRSIPDRPVGQLPTAPHTPPVTGPERNERCDVSESGVSPKVTWRPW